MIGKSIKEIETVAIVCHVANRAWCAMHGDLSQPNWLDAPQWQRDSAMDGVVHALTFPDAKPEDSHNNWLMNKKAEGWVYGPTKNTDAKTHPCIVPFDELPEWQQKKDALFLAIVRALA
jgi:hypothetical protein